MLKTKKLITALVTSLLLLFAASPLAAAQATGSGLSISPTLFELSIGPGQSKNITITLKNATVGSVDAQGTVNDFVSDNSTGNPKILTQPGASSPNSIKNFVFQLSSLPLDPGQQKNVTVGLHIPDGTPPGAYWGIIRYKAVPVGANAPAPGQVALTASVGTVVLITVPGNLRQQISLSAVHIYRGAHDGTLFFTKPDKIGVEIRNFGNAFVQPFGTVEVQNMFGKTVSNFQFNNPKQLGNVLPGSTRVFTNGFSGASQFGRYKATASVSYGSGSQVLTLTKTFWYVPAWLAIVVVLILLILIFLSYRALRRYRHESRHWHRGR